MFKENNWLRTEKIISSEASIFEVGYEDVSPRSPYQYEQLDYWLIHFIVGGEGLFFINNEVHQLGRGDGFVIPPHTDNNYYPLVGNPWSYRWIGVRGTACEQIFRTAGFHHQHFTYHQEDIITLDKLFAQCYDDFESDHLYGAMGDFYQVINTLQYTHEEHVRREITGDQRIVREATDYIRANYRNPSLRISQVAEKVQVERSYLYKLFMQNLTLSPKAYLIQHRINAAANLLIHSQLSISEIAIQSGFTNYNQFSKTFSQYREVTPRAFRKRYASEMNPLHHTWN